MNPADELRTAAERLRALAATATPGPWTADASIPYGHRVGSSDEADWIAWTGEHGETGSESDAAYIAAMGPPVAMTLADWLETAVMYAERWPPDAQTNSPFRLGALAVARAINGTSP
jgi:hypothetical protein